MSTQFNSEIGLIINILRNNVQKKGYQNLRIIGKIFRQMASYDGYNKINKDEFLSGLRDIGVLLPKSEAEKLVNYYDKDIDGCVHIEDFLLDLRHKPNGIRQEIIDIAFKKFDKDNSGYVDIRDLKGVFNASGHPSVVSGDITFEQAFDEFLKNFNDHTGSGKIQKLEWDDYYAAVSYNMDNDGHFVKLVKIVWQL